MPNEYYNNETTLSSSGRPSKCAYSYPYIYVYVFCVCVRRASKLSVPSRKLVTYGRTPSQTEWDRTTVTQCPGVDEGLNDVRRRVASRYYCLRVCARLCGSCQRRPTTTRLHHHITLCDVGRCWWWWGWWWSHRVPCTIHTFVYAYPAAARVAFHVLLLMWHGCVHQRLTTCDAAWPLFVWSAKIILPSQSKLMGIFRARRETSSYICVFFFNTLFAFNLNMFVYKAAENFSEFGLSVVKKRLYWTFYTIKLKQIIYFGFTNNDIIRELLIISRAIKMCKHSGNFSAWTYRTEERGR